MSESLENFGSGRSRGLRPSRINTTPTDAIRRLLTWQTASSQRSHRTHSCRRDRTGHDGIFLVRQSEVEIYVRDYRPQVLRLDIRTDCHNLSAMNYGESKGLSFDRVIIFPHGLGKRWLKTGDCRHIEGSRAKLYVGITRARFSVAFVLDGSAAIPNAQFYQPAEFASTASPSKEASAIGIGKSSSVQECGRRLGSQLWVNRP